MERPFLNRTQIREQLNNVFNYPLTLVVAAMGYGKTIAVKDFLAVRKADFVWLSVESNETSAHRIWDSLTMQIAGDRQDVGERLYKMGFPVGAAHRNRVVDLIEEWTFQAERILVIDDYQYALIPELDILIEQLVKQKISGLHIVVLSRTRPVFNILELKLKGYCYQLQSSLFELSQEEIKEYFRLYDQDISDAVAKQVHEITEGWISAVYLLCQKYAETGRLEAGVDLSELIQTTIVERYTKSEKKLLMTLSVLDSFTPSQAVYVTDNRDSPEIIHKLSRDNSFIRYDEPSQKYTMHNIFAGFLRSLLEKEAEQTEVINIYRRSGEWNMANGFTLTGLRFFLRARDYDLILQEFEKPGITRRITRVLDNATAEIVKIFEQIPLEVLHRYPIAYLIYADIYVTKVDMEGGAQLLADLEEYYQNDSLTSPAGKKRIAGEIELIRSFLFFNDLEKMHACCKKAYLLLNGRSLIANKDMIFSFGSPSTLYLYYREKGRMLEVVVFAEENFCHYEELSGGCGKGFECLIRAEYSLETCSLNQAELNAYRAVYKAETLEQVSVIISADFTLARLYAARGKFDEAKDLLDELSMKVSEYNNPIFMNALDLCYGYIGGITGERAGFAQWLKTGDMKHAEMFYQGLAFNYLVHAKYLLLEENYLKLEALCEEMYRLFAMFNNLLGHLHAHILEAIAKNHLYGLEKAKEAIEPALAIGRADGIIMPFAEYGLYIAGILTALARDSKNDIYLDRLLTEVSRYKRSLEAAGKNQTFAVQLTERERDVLNLLLEGQSNKEIAGKLFIAEITVKKNITSIYRKLGVSSRAAAVRKAMELKLVE